MMPTLRDSGVGVLKARGKQVDYQQSFRYHSCALLATNIPFLWPTHYVSWVSKYGFRAKYKAYATEVFRLPRT